MNIGKLMESEHGIKAVVGSVLGLVIAVVWFAVAGSKSDRIEDIVRPHIIAVAANAEEETFLSNAFDQAHAVAESESRISKRIGLNSREVRREYDSAVYMAEFFESLREQISESSHPSLWSRMVEARAEFSEQLHEEISAVGR